MQTKQNFLAGANTASGFISKFDEILKNTNGYTYILKGGPGTGKSTLMKTIANYFYAKGYSVEQYFCSSDINSLDAIKIVGKNICITDATSPHQQDASFPKVSGEIVNLGACVNKKVCIHRKEIEKLIEKKKQCFNSAYTYLKMAGELVSAFNKNKKQIDIKCDKAREVYLDYFSEKGIKSLLTLNDFLEINVNKKNLQAFLNDMKKEKNILFVNDVFTGKVKYVVLASFEKIYTVSKIRLDKENRKLFSVLCKKAGKQISLAKNYHKQIESIYLKYLNFNKLNKITKKLIKQIDKK